MIMVRALGAPKYVIRTIAQCTKTLSSSLSMVSSPGQDRFPKVQPQMKGHLPLHLPMVKASPGSHLSLIKPTTLRRAFATIGKDAPSSSGPREVYGTQVDSLEDFQACAELLRSSYELMAEDSGHPMAYIPKNIVRDLLLPKATANHLQERCAKDKIIYWLMRDQRIHEPVGMIGVSSILGDCPTNYENPQLIQGGHRLLQYTVRPDLRGKGTGRAILEMGHDLIQKLHPERVYFLAPAGPKLLALLKSGYVWVPEGDFFHDLNPTEGSWEAFNLSRIHDPSLIEAIQTHPQFSAYRDKLKHLKIDRFCCIHPSIGKGLPEGVAGLASASTGGLLSSPSAGLAPRHRILHVEMTRKPG